MSLIAVTRLRIRSFRLVPAFAWWTWRAQAQARRSPGNLRSAVRKAGGLAFWTMTAWQDEAAMKAYRIASPHREVMPKLLDWCHEASVVRWIQDSGELPDWTVAEMRMAQSGRLSKVRHPSADQRAGRLDYMQ
jgi:hypothetical protein